jgi:hypothetical protein
MPPPFEKSEVPTTPPRTHQESQAQLMAALANALASLA